MSLQNQNRIQTQNNNRGNDAFGYNDQRNPRADANANPTCPDDSADSFINNTMMYSRDTPPRDCVVPTVICLFNFTGNCEGNLCYGPLCSYHTQLASMRQYVAMTNEDKVSSRVVSVSIPKLHGRFVQLILSAMPVNKDLAFYEEWVKNLINSPQDERAEVAKFLCILCSNEKNIASNAEFASLKQYVAEVASGYLNLIKSYQSQLEHIKIPLSVSYDMRAELRRTSPWFFNMETAEGVEKNECSSANGQPDTEENKVFLYYVPIFLFNAFDILNFMTYNLEPGLNDEGYLPNCELVNHYIVHGTNYGIFNCVETYNYKNNKFNYPPQLAAAVNQQVVARVANLDVLSLYVVSDSPKVSSYIDTPVALLRNDTCSRFELSQIRSYKLFRYN